MNSLPPEIIRTIVSHLIDQTRWVPEINEQCPKTPLSSYAAISRQWQTIVETITFRHLILTSSKLTIADSNHYLTPLRLSYIRYIWFDFEFPAHNLTVSTNPEDYDDQLVFNKTVKQLLGVLSRIPTRPEPVVGLEIFISTPRKYCIPWGFVSRRPNEMDGVFHGRVRTTYVELLEEWDVGLPELAAIFYFRVELGSRSIIFSPSSINLIAAKMSRLLKVEWWLCDGEKVDTELRIRQRTMFAETLATIPKSLKCFRLEYIREPPQRRSYQPPSIVPPDAQGDLLSRSLHHFTQRDGLDDFFLQASVDSTIFWPQTLQAKDYAHWPSIRVLHVELNDVLPSGQWIDVPDSSRGALPSTPPHIIFDDDIPGEEFDWKFPSTYSQAAMDGFAFAAGKCAAHMPKIQELNVFHHGHSHAGICFNTVVQTEPCLEFAGDPDVPEPSPETLATWRETVKTHGLEWRVNITDDMANVHHFY
ncbi:hypothetical protein FSARC_5354 [Fusarium sarcochroum]|uniref:F-box domain-containing protein n=1 Tax=Fusarium sarcochroum TaxID=1208366 RepID=A0A8H4TZM9_9HYPO|nr:hypothetical protein FSARC_5354 [Fusarium sarcochroum]